MLGSKVVWSTKNRQVTIAEQNREIVLTIGSTSVQVDGETFQLDCPAAIVNDRTFVPPRFVSEALGAAVHWHEADGSINIVR